MLIEEALKDAIIKGANSMQGEDLYALDAMGVSVVQELYGRVVRAYLSHPAVLLAAADGVNILADHNIATAAGVLQSIGAEKTP